MRGQLTRKKDAAFPDKTAVVYGERRYTYNDFEQRVDRLANRLREEGLQKNDRVAFLCPNTLATLEAPFAVPAAGGILVTIMENLGASLGDRSCSTLKGIPFIGQPRLLAVDWGEAKPGAGSSGQRFAHVSACCTDR